MNCLVKSQLDKMPENADEEAKASYMKAVLNTVGNCEDWETAPVVHSKLIKLQKELFGDSISYKEEKKLFNDLMLKEEDKIKSKIEKTNDPVLTAIKYARTGNYIDFAALENVNEEELLNLLSESEKSDINEEEYENFKSDMEKAKNLVVLADNTGEIVLDKIMIEEIKQKYPKVSVTVIVRGAPVINDVTKEDAEYVGIDKIAKIIENGTAVAGTALELINKETKDAILKADLILSKGQGNFETLNTCGLNIYYVFLCKCQWFVKQFNIKKLEGVFVNDRRLKMED
ncbi:MAG: DUF89 family protein [Clostridiales bacterium]|nr:DUF89 family protein [Clostridiales bacterium]